MKVMNGKRTALLLAPFDPDLIASGLGKERATRTVRGWQNGRSLPPRGLLEALASITGIKLSRLREAWAQDRLERQG